MNAQYAGYLTHLWISFLDGNDNYPETVHEAYHILQRCENETSNVPTENDGVAFVNEGSSSGRDLSNITCYNCGQQGHYASQ